MRGSSNTNRAFYTNRRLPSMCVLTKCSIMVTVKKLNGKGPKLQRMAYYERNSHLAIGGLWLKNWLCPKAMLAEFDTNLFLRCRSGIWFPLEGLKLSEQVVVSLLIIMHGDESQNFSKMCEVLNKLWANVYDLKPFTQRRFVTNCGT